jgi:acyl carrier protein
MADVISLLSELAEDWEYTGDITPETRLFSDMGLSSLDIVVLGTAIQERYNQTFPFLKFYEEVGQRETPDIPIGDWVDFIYHNLK